MHYGWYVAGVGAVIFGIYLALSMMLYESRTRRLIKEMQRAEVEGKETVFIFGRFRPQLRIGTNYSQLVRRNPNLAHALVGEPVVRRGEILAMGYRMSWSRYMFVWP